MAETDCFLCQKPNCTTRCLQPNCNTYYCSELHYKSHILKLIVKSQPNASSKGKSTLAYQIVANEKNSDTQIRTEASDNDSNDTDEIKHICLPYKICNSDRLGRHFTATRDIKPLELILVDTPGVVGPESKSDMGCICCLKQCTGELRYRYCMKNLHSGTLISFIIYIFFSYYDMKKDKLTCRG